MSERELLSEKVPELQLQIPASASHHVDQIRFRLQEELRSFSACVSSAAQDSSVKEYPAKEAQPGLRPGWSHREKSQPLPLGATPRMESSHFLGAVETKPS